MPDLLFQLGMDAAPALAAHGRIVRSFDDLTSGFARVGQTGTRSMGAIEELGRGLASTLGKVSKFEPKLDLSKIVQQVRPVERAVAETMQAIGRSMNVPLEL